mmetsp:Transcript_49350/g.143042  ORF Transcript_49350/g.143042 Transcript_49350/m.143042 type:complete len:434 (-) Transcript_49350:61-1362(-)
MPGEVGGEISMVPLTDSQKEWPCPPCVIAFPLAVLLIVLMRRRRRGKVLGSKCEGGDDSDGGNAGLACHGQRRFRMVPCDRHTPVLSAEEHQMSWFVDFVQRICEVRHGIFYGEAGGEQCPSWAPESFTAALRQLRNRVKATGWPDGGRLHDPLDDVALASRLIAADLNVDEAAKLVDEYADYRQTTSGGVLPSREWLEYGIVVVPCEDYLGRPILNVRPRYHRPGKIALFRHGLRTTLDAIKAHALHKRKDSFDQSNPLEQYAMVWDFAGSGWRNLDWEAFHCTIHEGAHHYPNMGSQIYVLNVSAPIRWVWHAASRFMHPRVRRKCLLVAPRDVAECMRRVVPPELLPPEYGGTGAPWPGPEAASTLEDQVGALAAGAYSRAGVVPAGALPRRDAQSAPPAGVKAEPRQAARDRGGVTRVLRLRDCVGCFG